MSGQNYEKGEIPQPYGHGHATGDGGSYPPPENVNYPYQPQGQGYPGQPAPVSGQPQYGNANTAYTIVVGQQQMHIQAPPPDHFCLAIFVTLCCFWPTGIFAIMKASDARSASARGDMATAHAQASSAKTMINVSIGVGIASFVIAGIIVGLYVGLVLSAVPSYYG